MKITIIGTGYVGLVTGACLAEVGHFVKCLDVSKEKVDFLNEGRVPFYEPGLKNKITNANPINAFDIDLILIILFPLYFLKKILLIVQKLTTEISD